MASDWAKAKAKEWLTWTDSGLRDIRDWPSLAALLDSVRENRDLDWKAAAGVVADTTLVGGVSLVIRHAELRIRADTLAEVRRVLITEAPLAIRDDEVAVLSWVDAQLKRLEG